MKHNLVGKTYSGDELIWRSKEFLPELKIGFCNVCGFYHANPYPDGNFLSKYYDSYIIPCPLHQEERERVARILRSKIKLSSSIVDVGCGKGEMLETLANYGFTNLYGTECGHMRDEAAKLQSTTILPYDIEGLVKWCIKEKKVFDCVILINVLEHVPEPIDLMKKMKNIFSPEGMLMFSIPNDFNMLQTIYLNKTKMKPWFLILPDHVNFFSLSTIDGVMTKAGYKIVHKTVQYPLEFFLLQGDDYVARPEIGKTCHNKRVMFEEAFRSDGREEELEHIYEGFAQIGIGRDMYILAQPFQ